MHFADSYFKGEERLGFYIRPLMKRTWAGMQEVLAITDSICKVYGIRYYILYGTLLGAVRHKGFIPWDDDIDICMFRDDAIRFFGLPNEIFEEFGLERITQYTDPTYRNMVFRVVNQRVMTIEEEHLTKYHGCPFNIGIDIFTLDYIPEDKTREEEQDAVVRMASSLSLDWDNRKIVSKSMREQMYRRISETLQYEPDENMPVQQRLLIMADMLTAAYTAEDGEWVSNIPLKILYPNERYRAEWFGEPVMLQFENMMLPAPREYEKVLIAEYGNDYMTPQMKYDTHNYPYWKKQYEELKEFFKVNKLSMPKIFEE